MHLGHDLHCVILNNTVSQLLTGKTAIAEAVLHFPQIYSLHLIARFLCALGKSRRQRLGIAALARTGRKN